MTTLRPFTLNDLLKFNNVNLDVLTETYNMPFYLSYMSQWPECFTVAEAPNGSIMGYMLGKVEGEGKLWHGHVSAVTVAPEYRRLGLAKTLMDDLEQTCIRTHHAYFVDLFVRASNHVAIRMYEKFGYVTYRRVLEYYSSGILKSTTTTSSNNNNIRDSFEPVVETEDALDMRKALPRDVHKESIVPLDRPVRPEELEW